MNIFDTTNDLIIDWQKTETVKEKMEWQIITFEMKAYDKFKPNIIYDLINGTEID